MCKNQKYIFGLLLFIIYSLKCAQSSFVPTGNKAYAPWIGTVQIFQEPPTNKIFEEIGWVTGKMSGSVSDWSAILKSMQEKASLYGANAIILVDKETSNHKSFGGSLQYGFYGSSYQEKTIMARAIRIIEESSNILPRISIIKNSLVLFEDSNAYKIGERLNVKRGVIKTGMIEVIKIHGKKVACIIVDQIEEKIQINDEVEIIPGVENR